MHRKRKLPITLTENGKCKNIGQRFSLRLLIVENYHWNPKKSKLRVLTAYLQARQRDSIVRISQARLEREIEDYINKESDIIYIRKNLYLRSKPLNELFIILTDQRLL